MNVAVIFAGGVGKRMKSDTLPKQFLELHGKPIIIYTLEKFQNHPDMDGIIIVCVSGWIDYLKELIKKYSITKVKSIVPGGTTGQDSRFNGVKEAYRLYSEDTVILMHDGVRPLIDRKTISDNLESVKKYGNGITVAPAIETVTICKENGEIEKIIDRKKCKLAKAPQSFYLGDLYRVHKNAYEKNRHDYIDTAYLMSDYGFKLYPVEGNVENIKITTPSDFYMFKAIIDAYENSQIFG